MFNKSAKEMDCIGNTNHSPKHKKFWLFSKVHIKLCAIDSLIKNPCLFALSKDKTMQNALLSLTVNCNWRAFVQELYNSV